MLKSYESDDFHPGQIWEKMLKKRILFMAPFFTYEDNFHKDRYWEGHNSLVMKGIERVAGMDIDYKLHRKDPDLQRVFIPQDRIVDGKAEDLIREYDVIYCYSWSSIRKDTEIMGKKPILVDE